MFLKNNIHIIVSIYSVLITSLSYYLYTQQTKLDQKLQIFETELSKQLEINNSQAETITILDKKISDLSSLNTIQNDNTIVECGLNSNTPSIEIQNFDSIVEVQPDIFAYINEGFYLFIIVAGLCVAYNHSSQIFNVATSQNTTLITTETLDQKLNMMLMRMELLEGNIQNIHVLITQTIIQAEDNIIAHIPQNFPALPINNLLFPANVNIPPLNNLLIANIGNNIPMQIAEILNGIQPQNLAAGIII